MLSLWLLEMVGKKGTDSVHCFMQPADTSKIHNCIPDEHYVQTLLAVRFLLFPCLKDYCDGANPHKFHLQICHHIITFASHLVFTFWNLVKGPWRRNHTKISDTYCLGSFLQRSWTSRMASFDIQVLRCYSNAYKIY